MEAGALFLIPTPLGNLGDVTDRMRETLGSCDWVLAEDTRRTGTLLAALGLSKPQLSFHEHNERHRVPEILEKLRDGKLVALVSDAGMPLVSDPGFVLVRECIRESISVVPLPGPCAIPTALAVSGLPPVPFSFGGFLPVKSGRRAREIQEALARRGTQIYFESPHRIRKSLEVLERLDPQASVCVAREMTKKFEEFLRGTPGELLQQLGEKTVRGEITLLFRGSDPEHSSQLARDAGVD